MRISRLVVRLMVFLASASVLGAQDGTYSFTFANGASEDVYLLARPGCEGPITYHVLRPGQTVFFEARNEFCPYLAANRDYTVIWSHLKPSERIPRSAMGTQEHPVTADGRSISEMELRRGTAGLAEYRFDPLCPLEWGETAATKVFTDEGGHRGRELFDAFHYAFEPQDYEHFPWGAGMDDVVRLEEQRGALRLVARTEPTGTKGGMLIYAETYDIDPVIVSVGWCVGIFVKEDAVDEERTAQRWVWYYFRDGLSLAAWTEKYPETADNAFARWTRLTNFIENSEISYNDDQTECRVNRDGRHIRWTYWIEDHKLGFWLVAPELDVDETTRRWYDESRNRE